MRFKVLFAVAALSACPVSAQSVWRASTGDATRQVFVPGINGSDWPRITYSTRFWTGGRSEFGRSYGVHRAQVNCEERTFREAANDAEDPRSSFANVDILGTAAREELDFVCGLARQTMPAIAAAPAVPMPLPVQPPTMRPNKSAPDARPANKMVSTGSGFVVSPGKIITNDHVVQDCLSIVVRHGSRQASAELIARSANNDLAILQAGLPNTSALPVRISAQLGEEVMTAGYPLSGLLASDLIVTSGQVNALAGLGNDPMRLQVSAPVQAGNSGGALLDKSGGVVGVVVSKLNAGTIARVTGELPQNVNFAIKPEVLRLFLEANQISFRTASNGPRLDGTQLAALARRSAVQVQCLQ